MNSDTRNEEAREWARDGEVFFKAEVERDTPNQKKVASYKRDDGDG